MRRNISVYAGEEKKTSTGKIYWSFKTNVGQASVWDALLAQDLIEKGLNHVCDVELEENGKFKNIKALLGIHDVLTSSEQKSGNENQAEKNADLRRKLDCVLAANYAFCKGVIEAGQINYHAKLLHGMIGDMNEDDKLSSK